MDFPKKKPTIEGGLGGLGGPSSPPAPLPRIEAILYGGFSWVISTGKMVIWWEFYGDFQGFHRDVFFCYSDFMVILYFLFLDSFSLDIIGM